MSTPSQSVLPTSAGTISLASETILSLPQATRRLPGRPSLSTIYRWFQRGARGVKLETLLVGGKRYTSVEALQRFADAMTAAADGRPAPKQTTEQRERAIAAAERELEMAGW